MLARHFDTKGNAQANSCGVRVECGIYNAGVGSGFGCRQGYTNQKVLQSNQSCTRAAGPVGAVHTKDGTNHPIVVPGDGSISPAVCQQATDGRTTAEPDGSRSSECGARVPALVRSGMGCIPGGSDAGAVTAEFAMVLPAVVLMVVLLLSLTRVLMVSMSCQEAAGAAARELVISDGSGDVNAVAQAVAGGGAKASSRSAAGRFDVQVSCPVIPDPWNVLPTRVEGKAAAIKQ